MMYLSRNEWQIVTLTYDQMYEIGRQIRKALGFPRMLDAKDYIVKVRRHVVSGQHIAIDVNGGAWMLNKDLQLGKRTIPGTGVVKNDPTNLAIGTGNVSQGDA